MPKPDGDSTPSKLAWIRNICRIGNRIRSADPSARTVLDTRVDCLLRLAVEFGHEYIPFDINLLRGDVVEFVIFNLLRPAAVGLADGLIHRLGDRVGIHYHKAVDVSCGSPGGLGQRPSRAEEALLVSVQDRHKRHCRNIQSLTQKVHSDQNIEESVLEVLDDLHALPGVHIGVDVAHPDVDLVQIVGQLLGHPLGQGRDEYPLVLLGSLADLLDKIIDLILGRTHLDRRIQQACRPHNLFDHKAVGAFQLIVRRCGADIDLLTGNRVELIEGQRSVVRGSRKSETIFNKDRLSRVVAAVHRPDLRNRDVALVNERDEVLREIVDEAERSLTRLTAVQIAGVVLDARAVAHLLDHLKVVLHSLLQPFGLQPLANLIEVIDLLLEIVLDHTHGLDAALPRGHEVRGREDRNLIQGFNVRPGQRIDQRKGINLVTEKLNPHGLVRTSEKDIDSVSTNPERSPFEIHLRATVVRVNQMVKKPCETALLTAFHQNRLSVKILRVSNTIETGHAGDHDHVPTSGHQSRCRAEAQLVNLVIDTEVFLDVCIGCRKISLRLIIVVV